MEIGYDVEIHKISIFNKQVIEEVADIPLGSSVSAECYLSTKYWNATKIEVVDVTPCSTCLAPMDNSQDAQVLCVGCFNEENERLTGQWTVKTSKALIPKREEDDKKAVKLILQQEENILGYVTFPSAPFYNTLSTLKEDDIITLEGWRDKNRRSKLTLAKKYTTPAMRVKKRRKRLEL